LLFASEVKALFADPAVNRRISPQGLAQVFSYWCAIAPATVFEGVEQLVPGSFRLYGERGLKQEHRYWRASFPVRDAGVSRRTMAEAAEGLKEQLVAATRLRMTRADVPVGSYLSGGIDSSVIAWLAREHAAGEFRTFSLRFADAEFDETPFQRLMVQALGSVHDEIVVTREDIAEVFPEVIRHTEQPVLRTAPGPLYLLSRLVRDAGFKAVLTGEGADEMLAGYDIFREAKIRQFWARLPASTVRPLLLGRLYPYLKRSPSLSGGMATQFWRIGLERAGMPGFSHEPRWRTTSGLQRFFSADVKAAVAACRPPDYLDSLPAEFARWDPLEQAQFVESETLLSGYLLSSQGDRMLMAHSVEGRFPFLDAEVLEFCSSLDPLQKLPGLQEKAVLKHLARRLIPEPIVQRPKQPYRAPDAVCFAGSGAPDWVRECLSADALRSAGLFDGSAVDRLNGKLGAERLGSGGALTVGNADNMALVGILSAQLVHLQIIQNTAPDYSDVHRSVPVTVDYVAERSV
jgi:asparagine synthase (glutamine-hydrolysing)